MKRDWTEMIAVGGFMVVLLGVFVILPIVAILVDGGHCS